MLNYIKSEFYRVLHTKDIYLFTGVISILFVLMNIILFVSNTNLDNFPYGTVSFSLNAIIGGMTWLFVAGALVVATLYSGEKKYGTLKNTIAYGISREHIFLGKCMVSCVVAFFSMIIIFIAYIGSACLLLSGPVNVPIKELISGVFAVLLCAFASVILAVALFQFFDKEILAAIVWLLVMDYIPQLCFYAGLKIDILNKIAQWLPWNYLKYEVRANMSGYQCLWNTSFGLMKCIVTGVIGIGVFTVLGLVLTRKKEV